MTTQHPCGCGCGQPTRNIRGRQSKFRPGHDLKLVTALVKLVQRGDATLSEAHELLLDSYSPELARRFLALLERSRRAEARQLELMLARDKRRRKQEKRKGGGEG